MTHNGAVTFGGASVRTQCRSLGIVVTVAGRIDTDNFGRVSEYVRCFILPDTPFALDLSGVNGPAPQILRLVYQCEASCIVAGAAWSLVPGNALRTALRASGQEFTYPVAGSARAALHDFASATRRRRQSLLPLVSNPIC